jgi:hypothetical protein
LIDIFAWEHIAVTVGGGAVTIVIGTVLIQAGASVCTSIIGCVAGVPVMVAGVGGIGSGLIMMYQGGQFTGQYLAEIFEMTP